MSHSITAKLNKPAREYATESGVTFFVGLGEKNYDFKLKENVYTNYDAALFAKGGQVDFYRSALVEGAIISVSGTGLIIDISNTQYPKATIQDAKLGFVNSPSQGAPQQQQAPQMAPAYQPQPAPQYSQAPAPQPVPMSENDRLWVDAVKADPLVIDQIDDTATKERIKKYCNI